MRKSAKKCGRAEKNRADFCGIPQGGAESGGNVKNLPEIRISGNPMPTPDYHYIKIGIFFFLNYDLISTVVQSRKKYLIYQLQYLSEYLKLEFEELGNLKTYNSRK